MRFSPAAVVVALAALALAPAARAVTTPGTGAVALPEGLSLSWPFAAGEAVYVLSGYGPGGGSSLHDGMQRTGATNDYYALDLTLEEHEDHGKGQPVLAAATGVVVKAGWATAGWANYGQRVILEHDAGDGHRYVTLYAHLDSIAVVEGDVVAKGARIGALGSSCQGEVSCGSFGTPHLHFALHRDSTVGGSGTGGSYGGQAVVPEVIDGAADLARSDVHVSQNFEGEPPPPPPPDALCVLADDGTELVVEEDGPCARRLGPAEYWHTEDGSGGASLWTFAIDAASADNRVHTTLHVASAGEVELLVVVPAYATSERARYVVTSGETATDVVVDQAAGAGQTVSLGVFLVDTGPLDVVLADNTGEVYSGEATSKKLAFDAIVARRPGAIDDPVEPGEPEEPEEPEGPGEPEAPDGGEEPVGPEEPGVEDADDLGPSVTGCATTSGAAAPLALFGFLARMGARRRATPRGASAPP